MRRLPSLPSTNGRKSNRSSVPYTQNVDVVIGVGEASAGFTALAFELSFVYSQVTISSANRSRIPHTLPHTPDTLAFKGGFSFQSRST